MLVLLRTALGWVGRAFVFIMTEPERMNRAAGDAMLAELKRNPQFVQEAENAYRLDLAQGGKRNIHHTLDRWGVPDLRWRR